MYFDYPLEQGLRRRVTCKGVHHFVFWLSIRTRIKTKFFIVFIMLLLYFDYPLEQGLRLLHGSFYHWGKTVFWLSIRTRIKTDDTTNAIKIYNVFWLSIRTRIKTILSQHRHKLFPVFWLSIRTRIKTLIR